jgi:hypothetical protein
LGLDDIGSVRDILRGRLPKPVETMGSAIADAVFAIGRGEGAVTMPPRAVIFIFYS